MNYLTKHNGWYRSQKILQGMMRKILASRGLTVDPYDLVILGRYYESKTFGKECRYSAKLLNYSYWWNRSSRQVRSKQCSNCILDREYPHLKELTEIPKWILEDVLRAPQQFSKNDEIQDGI